MRPASVAQGVLTTAAFGLLIALFVRSDMSVELVARNSNSLKPMIFKIAGTWGNHEGSMLLWLMILSLSGGLIAIFEKRLREDTLVATLQSYTQPANMFGADALEFSKTSHLGSDRARLCQIQNERWVPASDYLIH